jgi:L-amino acid N-acyltransferase YncA
MAPNWGFRPCYVHDFIDLAFYTLMPIQIRIATSADRPAIWAILGPVFAAGETYTVPRDMTEAQALDYWFHHGHQVLVAEDDGSIVGTYFLQANQRGGGSHVANCGYVTATKATGRGVARAMCLDSLDRARAAGFRAMQFNFVVSSNERAVRLWKSLGFATVGTLPEAFQHPTHGYVDAFVMYRSLV